MRNHSMKQKIFHQVKHICCRNKISGNPCEPAPQACKETEKGSCLFGALCLQQQQWYRSTEVHAPSLSKFQDMLHYKRWRKEAYIRQISPSTALHLLPPERYQKWGLNIVSLNLLFSWLPIVTYCTKKSRRN
jgi:hypothetical protein